MSAIALTDTENRIASKINPDAAATLALSTDDGGLGFSNMSQAMEFAKIMAVAQVAVPKHLRGNVGACLAVTIQAVEWKMSPFAVANKSYSVNDRLAYESQLVQAVILQRAPIKDRFVFEYSGDGAKRRCKAIVQLKSGKMVEIETPELGTIPVKNSPLWKGDPDQQLAYYAGRALCRRYFPDVLLGIYTPEEMQAEIQHAGPDHARDVTPKGMAEKLAALAVAPARQSAPVADETFDAETGEFSQDLEEEGQGEATTELEPDADDPVPTHEEIVLSNARAATMGGRKAYNAWIEKQKPDDIDLLKPHEKALRDAAKQADARGQEEEERQ
eukprot:gene11871-11959_t